jgi:parallel beta-helix repeat protein
MSRLLRRLFSRPAVRRRPAPRVRPASYFRSRLFVQSLEARDVPATFTVTNTADSGAGSLRQAILNANASVNVPDTISFDATAFATPQTITLTSGELLITDDLTINGPGVGLLTVSGNNASRVFDINLLNRVLNVTMSGMTITGGRITSGDGGGMYTADENVTLNNMVISGNTVAGGATNDDSGGGIAVGGGGSLTVRGSTISGNSATGRGGGIYFYDSGGFLLDSSTVSGNTSTQSVNGGGGVYFYGTVGAAGVLIRNSTISGNTATAGSGGGVVLRNLDGTARIQNSTITNNTSGSTSTADGDGGGGLAINGPPGTLRGVPVVVMQSTIVSGNTASAVNGRTDIAELTGAQLTANNSAIGVNNGFTLTGSSGSNLPFGAALALQPLANNGGATQTVALGAGSAALDMGSNPASLANDQRGTGFARVQGTAADIGAFERPVNAPSASGTFPNVPPGGNPYTFTVTYTDATAINVSTLDNNDIRITGPNAFNQLATFVSVDNNTNGTPRTATYSFTAPGGTWDFTDNGTYTVSVESGQVANTNSVTVPGAAIGTFTVALPQTFTVTNTNDSGAGSLRDALTQANNTPGTADTIVFGPLFNTAQTISLTSGQLSVTDSVTITGPGAGLLTIRRDPAASTQFRIFNVSGTGVIDVTMTGLTITGGSTASGPALGTGGDGAGILLGDENLTLDHVVITGNSSGTEGGGIGVQSIGGNLVIRNSTISGNTANGVPPTGGFAGSGGGIYFANKGTLLLDSSTVSGNVSVAGEGGGIYFFGNVGTAGLVIRNSTISGNSAGANGGGIDLNTVVGTLLIQNSTITGNTAGGTIGGGGISQSYATSATISVVSSIVSGNANAVAPDILSGGTVNVNFSAVGSATGFTPSATSGNNLPFGTNLLLGPLADNGGPTKTQALGTGSPAINAGSNPAGLTTDQRGGTFARVSGPAADIGAFELQATAQAQVASVVVNAGQANLVQRSVVTNLTVTFDRLVSFTNGATNAFQLTRTGPGTPNGNVTLTVDTSGSTATQTVAKLTFSGSLTEGSAATPSLIDGNYALTVLSAGITGGLASGDSTTNVFRLFGDVNGDKAVNGLDLTAFRTAFGSVQGNPTYVPFLDFNGDGAIDGADLTQFRNRFGVILP